MIKTIIVTIIIADLFGFTWWALSGQIPPDGLFIGTITHHVISLIGD